MVVDINVRTSETSDLVDSQEDGSDSQASPNTTTENPSYEFTFPHSLKRNGK